MAQCPYCEAAVSDEWVERHERLCPKGPDSLTCPYCGIHKTALQHPPGPVSAATAEEGGCS